MNTLYVKNMVCSRCVLVVKQVFENQGILPEKVSLGEIVIKDSLSPQTLQKVDVALASAGFERIDERKAQLIESVKSFVIQQIHHSKHVHSRFNWSVILSEKFHYGYNYLSNLFSSVEGITLEQYIIRQKVEKAKELLFYDELNLTEIADRLGYSSVAHLSAQFKKITGFTPSAMKKSPDQEDIRKPIDAVS